MLRGMTKKEATAKAKALLKKMITKGWKIRVHENMGWHYSLKNGPVNLSEYEFPSEGAYYSCLVSNTFDGEGGLAMWTEERRHMPLSRDPNKCVARALWFAWSKVNEHYRGVKAAYEQLGLEPPAVI